VTCLTAGGYNERVAKDKPLVRVLWRASTAGIQLVVTTFLGFFIGRFLDKLLGTHPWLTIIFLILGIATGFRDLFRMAKESSELDKEDS
jgi:ATP synthase protein I